MTDKKEQARKLREAAEVLSSAHGISLGLAIAEMKRFADELDPPVGNDGRRSATCSFQRSKMGGHARIHGRPRSPRPTRAW